MEDHPFASSAPAPPNPFTSPSGPPPSYESVVDSSGGTVPTAGAYAAPAAATGAAGPSTISANGDGEFDIAVTDPVKQGEGVSAYVSYKVRTRTTMPGYGTPNIEVIRRFRDFAWLADRLASQHRGIIVPPLPEKSAVQKYQMATDFIEERRRGLQSFLARVAAHPVLRASKDFQLFLESPENEFALEVARAQIADGTSAQKRLGGAIGWFRGLGQATQHLVQGGSVDSTPEDPEYLKVRDYLAHLESHLGEAARQASRLLRKEGELGEAVAEFGTSVEKLGRLEEGNVQEAMLQLANKASELAVASRQRHTDLAARFESPLKEAVRYVAAVKAVCSDRAAALQAVGAAKSDLDAKKVRWAKLRGTPGSSSDKLAEAERDANEAEARARAAKQAYDEIVTRMTEELGRFQKERSAEMNLLLREFALAQAGLASDSAKAWGALLSELQAIHGGS